MKKNVLSLSITAALVGFGFAGGAQAIGLNNSSGSPIPPGTATALRLSSDGTGHFLYVPYYTVQGNNNTMINIVNTDSVNGKAVKVRFRGAANSDDVLDFQVFLSPNDVWTGMVYKNTDPAAKDLAGVTIGGRARLVTGDLSCTKPDKAKINADAFHTVRLDNKRTGDALANETREGYVEIFNMADIPPLPNNLGVATNALYTAITHVKGTPNTAPPCRTTPTNTAWTGLDADAIDAGAANGKGLYPPTTGLAANWIILNAVDAGAWSGQAPAIVAGDSRGVPTTGAIAYFPQTDDKLSPSNQALSRIALFTADPVLINNPTTLATYDLPDFSFPYTAATTPSAQVSLLSAALATNNIMNEFLTLSGINATSDWVLSMPTRRYYMGYDYDAGVVRSNPLPTPLYFNSANTKVIDRQICVAGTKTTVVLTPFDQEETSPTTPGAGVVISPQKPGVTASFDICGEASVLAFNMGETASASGLITSASGTFKATVARSAVDLPYSAGWVNLAIDTASLATGLPIIGYYGVRATSGAAAFGATFNHRTTRLQP